MKESIFVREVVRSINDHYGWARKIWAGQYGNGGMPDILSCVREKFYGFECKIVTELPKNMDSEILKHQFTDLQKQTAGGILGRGRGHFLGLINIRPQKVALVLEQNQLNDLICKKDLLNYATIPWVGYWNMDYIFGTGVRNAA